MDGVPCYELSQLANCSVQPKEIICVDDNSPCSLRQPLEWLGAMVYSRRQHRSEGRPHVGRRALARQTGAEVASAKYLLFLDADILMNSQALSAIWHTLTDNGSRSVAFCSPPRVWVSPIHFAFVVDVF